MDEDFDEKDEKLKNKQNFEKLVEDSALCPICHTVSDEAMESECCGQIFCNRCINKVESNICPMCRRVSFKVHPSLSMRKLIKSLPVKCLHNCGYTDTIENIKKHYFYCKNRDFTCRINKCGCVFKKDDFICHVVDEHEDILIAISENFDKIFPAAMIKKLKDPSKISEMKKDDLLTSEFLKFSCLKYSYFDEVIEFD